MSLALKPVRPAVEWLGEPELAFAHGLTHIDPKVGIPAAGPWSRDQPNHPSSMTAGFIGTAECIPQARAWLSRAAEGVDGDDDHHPFCGFQATGPFASHLRVNWPEAKITASDIHDLTADKLKRLDGLNHLLALIDDRLMQLASLDASPVHQPKSAVGLIRHRPGLAWPGLGAEHVVRRVRNLGEERGGVPRAGTQGLGCWSLGHGGRWRHRGRPRSEQPADRGLLAAARRRTP